MSVLSVMSSDLLLDIATIDSIARRKSGNYRRIVIQDNRVVWEPTPQLRLLQYWVTDFLKKYGERPRENATAYEIGSSIVSNATMHRRSNHVLKLDIRHFFPSIGSDLIRNYLTEYVEYELTEEDINLILEIVMFRNGLVMGASSSPYIANRIMIPVDDEIERLSKKVDSQMIYTRYCDDLFFSSKRFIQEAFISDVEEVLDHFGFELNLKKTQFMGRGSNKWMAGVAINSERKVSLGQRRKAELRRRLYEFALNEDPDIDDARRLQGYIAFTKQIEPQYVDRMLVKYASYGSRPIIGKIHDVLS